MENELTKTEQPCTIHSVTCRYLFIYVDSEYKFIQYVEAKNQEEAEQKVAEGWIRVVELVEDLQVVYNGS